MTSPCTARELPAALQELASENGGMPPDNQHNISRLALNNNLFWSKGQTLRIKFLNGNDDQKAMVRQWAPHWLKFANSLHMEFVEYGKAEIRVAFKTRNGGHWSLIGIDCLDIKNQNEETMNFDPDGLHTENEFRSVILHEFGHALGCIHEHQSPDAGIQWNREFTINYYKQHFGWTKELVEADVFEKAKASITKFSAFDRFSIMLYPIPPGHAKNITQGYNNYLSTMDRSFINQIYGNDFPGTSIPRRAATHHNTAGY